MNVFVGIWILVATFAQIQSETVEPSVVNVTVFYESLCPDSRRFIQDQLTPTYNVLGRYMNVRFVPFGKASFTLKPWKLVCQHGPSECWGNMLHACALAKNPQQDDQVKIIDCLMSEQPTPDSNAYCLRKVGKMPDDVINCARGDEAKNLMIENGDMTKKYNPKLRFVPAVFFNGEHTKEDQDDSMKNLTKVICRKLPQPPEFYCNL